MLSHRVQIQKDVNLSWDTKLYDDAMMSLASPTSAANKSRLRGRQVSEIYVIISARSELYTPYLSNTPCTPLFTVF
jgi:hypothetical protein